MNTLLTIHDQDIDPQLTNPDESHFSVRQAVRAVVLTPADGVLFIYVKKYHFHKLPGGGIEAGEDPMQALQRELKEEVGYGAQVLAELGRVAEYRGWQRLRQISDCYLARQTGTKTDLHLDDYEQDDGFEPVTAVSLAEAIRQFESDEPTNLEGQFIKRRDLAFLLAAQNLRQAARS